MRAIKDILKENNIRAKKYHKIGKSIVIDTDNKRYVIKEKFKNQEVFDYLDNRNFNYYPKVISSNYKYALYDYIEDSHIPKEQKMNDLISFVSLLHNKTTYYKSIDEADYKKLYEDLSNNIIYLYEYYNDLITIIESKVYPSPVEYLLECNISLFFSSLKYCEEEIQNWYNSVKDLKKMRVCLIHNNLSLDHFIENNQRYLISWDRAKTDIPIFDLYKLYNKYSDEFDFYEILKLYQKDYPLKGAELKLLCILISMPIKLEFNKNNFDMCIVVDREISRLKQSYELIKKTTE